MLGFGLRRALAALLLTATGFVVRAFELVPPAGLGGLFGINDGGLAAGDSVALVHAAAAILAIIPLAGLALFPLAWSCLGALLWVFVCMSALTSADATAGVLLACVAMVLAYTSAAWLLLPTTFAVGGGTRPTFATRAVQGFAVTIPVLLVGFVATPAISPPNGLTREQYAFCTQADERVFGGQDLVREIAVSYLGTLPPETSTIEPYRDPDWATACRYSYVLMGLSADQSVWCVNSAHRPNVQDAVEILGAEGHGASFPGDSQFEYTQACRLAYRYLRGPSPAPITPEHEAFALTSKEEAFCESAGVAVVAAQLREVGLEPPGSATAVELAASHAVGCRLAFIADTFDRAGT